ncbi:hypothetical protein ACFSHP_12095 [Novosphingobium panipatense]
MKTIRSLWPLGAAQRGDPLTFRPDVAVVHSDVVGRLSGASWASSSLKGLQAVVSGARDGLELVQLGLKKAGKLLGSTGRMAR